jgi:rRNA maturation RNase YbeY
LACSEEAELSVLIVADPEMALLNQRYLGREGPTNVLAFPMDPGDSGGPGPVLLGDVVVSLDTARREAAQNGLDPDEHLMRLLIHGILHLLGYDHVHDEEEARRMETLTEVWLTKSAGLSGEE